MNAPRALRWTALTLTLGAVGCARGGHDAGPRVVVRGSDTLVQVAAAWAEAYAQVAPEVGVTAAGGGSGTGIAGLLDGTVDVATSSRELHADELKRLEARYGRVDVHVVGYDALALFVHPSNPTRSLSLSALREIWAEGGAIDTWSQVMPDARGRIVLVGRQNGSGTYDYFRGAVCGRDADGRGRELRGGISELNGSAEVVEKVASAPLALGYTGMGYKTEHVRWLPLARTATDAAVEPSRAAVRDGSYPLARALYVITAGTPRPEVEAFVAWTRSTTGQLFVADEGYVPLDVAPPGHDLEAAR
jgi:phosphate transport system substrate-binding protein